MGDCNKQICRLCLLISPTCDCETIDAIKKEVLQVLQINIDFDISKYAVACNRCLKKLHDCFDYKSHIIKTLMDDFKKISQNEMIGENLCLEKFQVCQLCMSCIKEEAFSYTSDLKGVILLKDMIEDCFPEVDIQEPLICKQCVSSLERHYEFIKKCQEVEQNIVHFRQVANHCTADKVNLEDMLKYKDYDMLSTPGIIKKECSDAENIDENARKCTEGEKIANIKCEEIHIKNELVNGAEQSGSYQLDGYDNLVEIGSSDHKREVEKCEPKEKKYLKFTKRFCSLKYHIDTQLQKKQHCCTLCSFVTGGRSLLQDHMATHKGATKRYGCGVCSYETNYKYNLEFHIIKHKDISEVEMHKCLLCPFRSKHKEYLARHHKCRHNKIIKMYMCREGSFSTTYRRSFVKHHLVHEDRKVVNKFKCEKCPFWTKEQEVFRIHMAYHLPKHTSSCQAEAHTDPSEVPKFQCTHCPYKTAVKAFLSSHIRLRHYSKDQRSFKCDLCRFATWDESHLKQHQFTHIELGPWEPMWHYCSTCDFKTLYKHSLMAHTKRCAKKQRIKDTDDKNN